MDLNMVKYLAELSKLEYSDKAFAATAEQMTDIIDLYGYRKGNRHYL